jgi:hypothetical protein
MPALYWAHPAQAPDRAIRSKFRTNREALKPLPVSQAGVLQSKTQKITAARLFRLYPGLSQNFGFCETGFACPDALDLYEKAGLSQIRPLFRKLFSKPAGFWEKLIPCAFWPANTRRTTFA